MTTVHEDSDPPGRSAAVNRVVIARTADELQEHVPAIEDLVAHAIEPNAFYEPWILLPAVHAFAADHALWFVMVYEAGSGSDHGRLQGFFPLQRGSHFSGVPVTVFRLWKYGTAYCGICTPLIRREAGSPVLESLHDWASNLANGPAVFEWQRVNGDGPVYRLLVDYLNATRRANLHVESRTRPLLCRRSDAESFLLLGYSPRHRNTFRRKERRLAEEGRLEYREVTTATEASRWVDEFIRLEAGGWKADQPSALAATDASGRFFRDVVEGGVERGRVMLLSLTLDGTMIAAMCNLLAAPGSYLYKVAFDERFGRNSPGELLQVENIRRVHGSPDVQWMDSLAEPSFEHVYRWLDRRLVQSVVWSTGHARSDLALAMWPIGQWIKRRVRSTRRAGA